MFHNRLNFHLHYDGTRNIVSVLNAKPENGELSEYLPAAEDPTHRGYTNGFGYIAVTTNIEGNVTCSLFSPIHNWSLLVQVNGWWWRREMSHGLYSFEECAELVSGAAVRQSSNL